MQRPKLKDSNKSSIKELYPLGEVPHNIIKTIGKRIIYNYATGKNDINGEEWGNIFAEAIGGKHFNSPMGLADVVYDKMAWSLKSVKAKKPHACKNVRVISGRCSPDYSYGIENPHDDISKTGKAVLNIWNERINIAKETYEPLRSGLLIRNPDTLEFTLHEYELYRFNTSEYLWEVNTNGNLQGKEINTGKHKFTWQPHGSQFTILYNIPASCIKFKVKKPPILDFKNTLRQIGFTDKWITIL